jgi:hypothetical protein
VPQVKYRRRAGEKHDSPCLSKSKFHCYLPDPRIVRVGYDAKASAVDQAARRDELCVIEDIEKLEP